MSMRENSLKTSPFAVRSIIAENKDCWEPWSSSHCWVAMIWSNMPSCWKRVSLGLFFAISWANKLFVAGSTQTMYETLAEAKVPFPHLMTYFVSGVEFVGGSLLTVGFLSSLACMALLVDMLVAILTTKLSAMPKGFSPLNWLDDFLYLPEVLYVLFFIWLICSGPGKFSVDYWLAGTLLR